MRSSPQSEHPQGFQIESFCLRVLLHLEISGFSSVFHHRTQSSRTLGLLKAFQEIRHFV